MNSFRILAMFLLLTGAWALSAQTVTNGDFESWTGDTPDGWTLNPVGTDIIFSRASNQGVIGDALKILGVTNGDGFDGIFNTSAYITGIQAGQTYDLNIKVKGDNKVWIRYWDTRWYNSSGNQVGTDIDYSSYSSDIDETGWYDYGVSDQTAPDGAVKLLVNFRVYIQSGFTSNTSYILADDLTVVDQSSGAIMASSINGFGDQMVGILSSENTYEVSGTGLTDDIIITPPAGFLISTDSDSYIENPSSITLTQTGGVVTLTTIYVKFNPTAIQAYSGNITHTSTDVTDQNASVSGNGIDYYSSISSQVGESMKSALHNILKGHTQVEYSDNWEQMKDLEKDPDNADNVLLIYTRRSQDKEYRDQGTLFDYSIYDNGNGNLSDAWNREHQWPSSHGFSSDSDTAYSDLFNLRAADRSVNSSRNNKDYDYGTEQHTEATLCYSTTNSWQPPDEMKGDIARSLFYMVVRYDPGYQDDGITTFDLELDDNINTSSPMLGKLSTLLQWHIDDPVSDEELLRCNKIYNYYQGNRNPFVDHPEYVGKIWGTTWTGDNANSNWAEADNWDNGSPTTAQLITIPQATNNPVLDQDLTTNTIIVEPGAYLKLNTTKTLTINGTLSIEADENGSGCFIDDGILSYGTHGTGRCEIYLTQDKWHYITSSINNNSRNFSDYDMELTGGTGNDQFHRWDETTGTWIDILNGSGSGSLMSCEGFQTAKGYIINFATENKTVVITGEFHAVNETITLTLTNGTGNGWNMVGNIFPCTIAMNSTTGTSDNFLTDNASLLDDSYTAIYYWDEQPDFDGDRDDYEIVNHSTGANYASVAQSFMLKAKIHNTSLNHYTSHRKFGSASFYKTNDDIPRIKLALSNSLGFYNSTVIAFNPLTSLALDKGYDAAKKSGNPDISFYSIIVGNNPYQMAIQTLPLSEETPTSIPLGMSISLSGEYKITLVDCQNISPDTEIILKDISLNEETNLQTAGEYNFNLDNSGEHDNRFVIQLKEGSLDIQQHESAELILSYFDGKLSVKNLTTISADATVQIFDILGHQLNQTSLFISQNQTTEKPIALKTGIYLLKLHFNDRVINEKIFVK